MQRRRQNGTATKRTNRVQARLNNNSRPGADMLPLIKCARGYSWKMCMRESRTQCIIMHSAASEGHFAEVCISHTGRVGGVASVRAHSACARAHATKRIRMC